MAILLESSDWEEGIYRSEATDSVRGGEEIASTKDGVEFSDLALSRQEASKSSVHPDQKTGSHNNVARVCVRVYVGLNIAMTLTKNFQYIY